MATNNKPATALPLNSNNSEVYTVHGATVARTDIGGRDEETNANAAYIAHACNAYPELVEALKDITGMRSEQGRRDAISAARALLAKLGE